MGNAISQVPSILAVDDHPLFLAALSELIKETFPDYAVVKSHTAEEALSMVWPDSKVKAIILDFTLPFLAGHSAISAFAKRFTGTPIIVLSGIEDRLVAEKAIEMGAVAFFSKSIQIDKFCNHLDSILKGQKIFSRIHLSDSFVHVTTLSTDVTPRQNQILECLSRGLSNKQIASDLCIAEITVKKHISGLFNLFNVRNRSHLIIKAKNTGLVA